VIVDIKFNRNISILVFILFFFVFACSDGKEQTQAPVSEKPSASKKQYVKYGINCQDLTLIKDTIQPHQNLSDILSTYMVPGDVIHAVAFSSKPVFDVRTIKAGNSFCIIRDNNPTQKVRYIVYEINPVDYVVFKLEDPATTSLGKKPVRIEIETVSESIESSLWETLTEKDIDTELAVKLSEIYAWTIDFHHLQKGDGFQAIYEKKFIKDKFIGLGKILAARFYHQNVFFYAFYFEQNGHGSYFDEHANSLEKKFLKAPIKFSRITSGYSKRRFHPILKKYRAHFGIDYAAKTGTPIMSTGDGVVVRTGYDSNNGRYVKIRHNGIYTTQYLHMSRFARGIKPRVKVKQGDIIGYVGSTGLATGPHVCYRFWKNGRHVNPLKEDIPSVEPVKKENHQQFNQQMAELKQQLNDLGKSMLSMGINKEDL
jgi:murein DD-endopeptidase MepM/ murein hydrolase activator NlpD